MPKTPKKWPPVAKLTLVLQAGRVVTVSTSGTVAGAVGNNRRTAQPSTITSWTLSWGDGTSNTGSGYPNQSLTHTYAADYASVVIRLTVVDANTLTAAAAITVANIFEPQVPPAPTNLSATAVSDSQINLAWTDPTGAAAEYALNRARLNDTVGEVITIDGADRTYSDTGLDDDTTYTYRIQGINAVGSGDFSNTAQATTFPTVPPIVTPTAPSNLVAVLSGALQINLTWDDNSSNESGFVLERDVNGGGYAALATVGAGITTYSDLALTYASQYTYRVRAYNAAGASANATSNTITTGAAPPPAVPSAPTGFGGTAISPTTITLAWVDVAVDETGYTLERQQGAGLFLPRATLPQNTVSYTDATCLPATSYIYRIAAFNANGSSAFVNSSSIQTPAAPPPAPPTCSISTNATVEVGTQTVFTTTAAPGSSPLATWVITFGDSQSTSGSGTPPAAPAHTYAQAGTYNVTLSVTDTASLTATFSTTATVDPVTPIPPIPPVTYIDLNVGDNYQAIVNAAAVDATFRFRTGIHRFSSQLTPKQGQTFFPESTTNTIVSGAQLLTNWSFSGGYWSCPATASAGSGANCIPGRPRCDYPNELFIDNVRQLAVDSLAAVTSGTWYFDFGSNRAFISVTPSGRTIELSKSTYAFGGSINDVTLTDLIIEKFANPAQQGAVGGNHDAIPLGSGWTINGGHIRRCHGLGLRVATGMQVLGTQIYEHGQLGIGGGGTGIIVDGISAYLNNAAGFYYGWEGGNSKFAVTTGLIVRNSTFRNGFGPGLWLDINNTGYELYQNSCNDNAGDIGPTPGIYIEISLAGSIHDNTCLRNGLSFNQWLWGSGIVISSSGSSLADTEIYNNILSGNAGGVTIVQNPRPEFGGNHITQRIYTHDNTITFATGFNGAAQDIGDNNIFLTRNNRWDYNHYFMSGSAQFAWLNGGRDWTYWRATAGMDLHGALN